MLYLRLASTGPDPETYPCCTSLRTWMTVDVAEHAARPLFARQAIEVDAMPCEIGEMWVIALVYSRSSGKEEVAPNPTDSPCRQRARLKGGLLYDDSEVLKAEQVLMISNRSIVNFENQAAARL